MDLGSLITVFLITSLTGSTLTLTIYSLFKKKSEKSYLLLLISLFFLICFTLSIFLLLITLDIENYTIGGPLQLCLILMIVTIILIAIAFLITFIVVSFRSDLENANVNLIIARSVVEDNLKGLDDYISHHLNKK